VIRKARDRRLIWSTRAIGSSAGISHTTARQIMIEKGIKFRSYNKQLKLTEENMKERFKFSQVMKKRESDWGFIVFSDECSFWQENTKPNKIWTEDPLGEEGTGTKGIKLHVWGAICANGRLKLEMFEDNMTATKLVQIMNRRLPELNFLYPHGFIWQQDGSGVHRAKIVQDFIEENMPQKVVWPSYSPDLSPIENVWSWLKAQVAKDSPRSLRGLKASIKKHWDSMTPEFLAPFINSMPKRMEILRQNKGGKIKY